MDYVISGSLVQFELLTLSGQSGSGPRFHSRRSLAPSSLLTAAHSGDTFAAVSLGGSCCFRGFFRGLGSRLLGAGGGAPAPASSTISEEIAEMVDDPEDSGLGGESWSRALPWMFGAGASPSGRFLRMEGLGEPGTSLSGSDGCCCAFCPGAIGVILAGVIVAGL